VIVVARWDKREGENDLGMEWDEDKQEHNEEERKLSHTPEPLSVNVCVTQDLPQSTTIFFSSTNGDEKHICGLLHACPGMYDILLCLIICPTSNTVPTPYK
jgi:hypothetical protein